MYFTTMVASSYIHTYLFYKVKIKWTNFITINCKISLMFQYKIIKFLNFIQIHIVYQPIAHVNQYPFLPHTHTMVKWNNIYKLFDQRKINFIWEMYSLIALKLIKVKKKKNKIKKPIDFNKKGLLRYDQLSNWPKVPIKSDQIRQLPLSVKH